MEQQSREPQAKWTTSRVQVRQSTLIGTILTMDSFHPVFPTAKSVYLKKFVTSASRDIGR